MYDRYQRILHRNLMEMANYIDSLYGVYSSSSNNNTTNAPPPSASSPTAMETVSSDSSADDSSQVQRLSVHVQVR